MSNHTIVLPGKPRVIKEEKSGAMFEIDGLYPGYGHTLGNSLRRIILSSLPGVAITSVKIGGVAHEFSTIAGVKEDVVTLILNLKKVRFSISGDEPQTVSLKAKGVRQITAGDIKCPGQVTVINPDLPVATLTSKDAELDVEMHVERGLGYVSKDVHQKERVDIGSIAVDAIFSPIRRVNYEVENMRVGDRTDFNRLRIFIETDGTIAPREAIEQSISIMISQLKAIIGFKEDEPVVKAEEVPVEPVLKLPAKKSLDPEFLKTRIETIGLSSRVAGALAGANIRTLGGLVRKKEEDILDIEGMGTKGVQEIKKVLAGLGVLLKE